MHESIYRAAIASAVTVVEVAQEAEDSGKHTPGSWQKEGYLHHLKHAAEHMAMVYDSLCGPFARPIDLPEDLIKDSFWLSEMQTEIDHAICRLGMAKACLANGLLADYGPEGNAYNNNAAL